MATRQIRTEHKTTRFSESLPYFIYYYKKIASAGFLTLGTFPSEADQPLAEAHFKL
jgi:hypothetical protein